MTGNVLLTVHNNGVAEITLNQPKSINSLTYDMLVPLKKKLLQWEKDPEVHMVILRGAGEKGFCAGGDMKALYEAGQQEKAQEEGKKFFTLEYEVDRMMSEFAKPMVACLDGIVMGGGVGLGYGAEYRIVTEYTKWAMPEMNIGFFPDVGAAYFLNKAPGHMGRYLALTSTVINGSEVIAIGTADYFMKRTDLERFIEEVRQVDWKSVTVSDQLKELIDQYTSEAPGKEVLEGIQDDVDKHFRFDSVEEIIASLEKADSTFAEKTKHTLLEKSAVSLKVTLKHLVEQQGKSFAECLKTDLVIAVNFMENPDFFEGVRSVLVDKDHAPDYKYKHLSDVSEALVDQFFD